MAANGIDPATAPVGGSPATRNDYVALAGFLVLAGATAVAGMLLGGGMADEWYDRLLKPVITPPDAVFGPVWTILYVFIGVAGWLVWRERHVTPIRVPMIAYGIQLVLNAIWTGLFFGMHRPGLAFVEILLLWAAIAVTIRLFEPVRRQAGWLMAPYLLWVTYAAVLNFAIWRMN